MIFSTETREVEFSGCRLWWSKKSLNLQLLLSGTFFGAGEVNIVCRHRLLKRCEPPSNSFVLKICKIFKVFYLAENSGSSRRGLFVSNLKDPSNICFKLDLIVPVTHSTFLNGKDRNIPYLRFDV